MTTLENKANKLFNEKKWEFAHLAFNELINSTTFPQPELFAKLAVIQRQVGLASEAKKTLVNALTNFPDNFNLKIEFGALENSQGNWKKALQFWESAKKQTNSFSQLNYQRYALAFYKHHENLFFDKSDSFKKVISEQFQSEPEFEKAILELIRKNITEIRNNKKNKNLALRLSKSSDYYFDSNPTVKKELAISYMHSHEWVSAINTFSTIRETTNYLFDSYDHHRFLKCYEMTGDFTNYEPLLLEGIRKFPDNQDLQFRLLFISAIQNIKQQDYKLGLQKINLLLGSKKPTFWNLDTQALLKLRNECVSKTKIKSIHSNSCGLAVIANRADGLGERLNAMLNAIVMAKTLGYEFGYTWKNLVHAQHFQKGTENKDNLVGHAIIEEQEFFDPDFINEFSVTTKEIKSFRTVTGKQVTYEDLFNLENKHKLGGWFSPRLALKDHFSQELLVDNFNYADAFSFITFNKPIEKSIQLAKKVMQSTEYIALHLRSGDVFYGEYRKFLHYSYKGIVLPLAKKIIEDHIKQGFKVIVFGQDNEVLSYLKKEYKVILVEDIDGFSSFDNTQKAMFEIILMSRANTIISGSSGFAKLASWIGNKEIKTPMDFYNSKKQSAIIKADLSKNAALYPKLQTSFAYWYAYFYGRNSKNIKQIDFFLSKAYSYDQENPLYPIVLSSQYYKVAQYETAELILNKLFNLHNIYEVDKNPVCSVLKAKTMGKYNILEFIPIFEVAAKLDQPFALLITCILEENRGNQRLLLNNLETHINKNSWINNFYYQQQALITNKKH